MNDSMNVAGEQINMPEGSSPRTRSRFPSLSYHLFNTERFGEYTSNFVMECVEGDKVPIRSGGEVQSYTLGSPLMQSISKKKDYYMVPMEAILPLNWDKFYTNPTIGDDVQDEVGTGVEDFWAHASQLSTSLLGGLNAIFADTTKTDAQCLTAIFRFLVILEYWYSNGSLITTLGCHGSHYCRIIPTASSGASYALKHCSFDEYFDKVISAIMSNVPYITVSIDGQTKYVILKGDTTTDTFPVLYPTISVRDWLQYLRDDLTAYVISVGGSVPVRSWCLGYFATSGTNQNYDFYFDTADNVNYNLARLWSYQLVCAHFYSNDHIDYIYSANLLRELVAYYCDTLTSTSALMPYRMFVYNGLNLYYDYMSAHYCNLFFTVMRLNVQSCLLNTTTGYYESVLAYFSTLFSYRRSLRFVDYFTGSRTRPLAVGDVNVNVNSNLVNVVDISRNIQRQRFFNAVNRFGRKFEEYIKGLSGVTPAKDYHNPLYLAHTNDVVYGVDVENTGVDQLTVSQSVTSRLRSNGARYQFEFNVDRPCIVIGITYYDIPRVNLFSTERQLLHMNRFDMFNPFMQFIGDQAVFASELGTPRAMLAESTFGYQMRHMEYKQRFDQAAGGFVENLPGYVFGNQSDPARITQGNPLQNVDFIRSLNTEIDRFYVSLTGYSLGSYFHFIVDNDNFCDASRPMAYAPSIL